MNDRSINIIKAETEILLKKFANFLGGTSDEIFVNVTCGKSGQLIVDFINKKSLMINLAGEPHWYETLGSEDLYKMLSGK